MILEINQIQGATPLLSPTAILLIIITTLANVVPIVWDRIVSRKNNILDGWDKAKTEKLDKVLDFVQTVSTKIDVLLERVKNRDDNCLKTHTGLDKNLDKINLNIEEVKKDVKLLEKEQGEQAKDIVRMQEKLEIPK